jgi:ketosteroid isomerase-like protein
VPWVVLIGAVVVLLLAVVGLVWSNRIVKEQIMQTLERPEVEVSPRPRSPAFLILAAALLVLAAGALGWWIGSSSDDVGNIPEIVELWNQAFVDGDGAALAALYTEDGAYERIDVSTGVGRFSRETGRAGIQEQVALAPDFETLAPDRVAVLEDVIIYQWTAKGTTPIVPFETTGVTVFEMEDGLIAKSVLYFNSVELYGGESS